MDLPIQRKAEGSAAAPQGSDAPATAAPASGGGQPLPEALRARMERVFGAALSAVRVHEGPQAEAVGARAYTQGTDIHFAPGQYDPASKSGQELIGHELAHVVQQARGGVQPTTQAGGMAINDSSGFEREADDLGARAAAAPAGGVEHGAPGSAGAATGAHAPAIQASRGPAAQLQGPTDAEKKQAATLTTELKALIDHAVWKEIRKTAYPKESKAGIGRAKERKEGVRPDLTGLGQIKTLEHFAAAIKGLQITWPKLSPDDRAKAVGKALDDELDAQKIPKLLEVKKIKTEFKGSFSAGLWRFNLSEALVNQSPLGDADAAELCNTGLHEARHAEQAFLAARFAAGPPDNKTDAQISAEQGIPLDPVAKAAVAQKYDNKTDPAVAALGKEMYKANVTDGAKNQQISDDDYLKEMEDTRKAANLALQALKAAITTQTLAAATTKRDELKAAVAEVERRYTLYRNIPYEADAHEVGDAAEQAFKGWP
ncbi:MAG TPA: DUF4157 domain-containing protein [Kofleriaceae bacterium]|nr:DUF4157 domain-containing protein [Kofleriaceae bacterium]